MLKLRGRMTWKLPSIIISSQSENERLWGDVLNYIYNGFYYTFQAMLQSSTKIVRQIPLSPIFSVG